MKELTRILSSSAVLALLTVTLAFAVDRGPHSSKMFEGPKANTGTVEHLYENNNSILRVSKDFKVPDTPAPTWRIVDSQGTVYTLDAFKIKGGEKRQVNVPSYVRDIAKVQVYCAWAEVLLGEAEFASPVKYLASGRGQMMLALSPIQPVVASVQRRPKTGHPCARGVPPNHRNPHIFRAVRVIRIVEASVRLSKRESNHGNGCTEKRRSTKPDDPANHVRGHRGGCLSADHVGTLAIEAGGASGRESDSVD